MFDILLKIIILLSATNVFLIGAINTSDKITFYLSIFALFIASYFCEKVREIKSEKYIYLFMSLILVNLLAFKFKPEHVAYCVRIMFALLAYVLIVQYTVKPKDCYRYFLYGVALNLAYFGLQKMGCNFFLSESPASHPGGLMGSTPRLAIYLSLVLPYMFSFKGKEKYFGIALYIGSLVACLCGDKQTSILLVSFIFGSVLIDKKYFIPLMILFIVGVFFSWNSVGISISSRYDIYSKIINKCLPYWNMGVGIGNKFGVTHPHMDSVAISSILQFVCCSGVLGLAWLAYLFQSYVRCFNKSKECLAILGLIILSTVEYPFEIVRLWIIIISQFAFFEISLGEDNNG